MIAPLAPALPPLGAGAHAMSRKYLYRDSLNLYVHIIQHYRNWDVSAACEAPDASDPCKRFHLKVTLKDHMMGADAPIPHYDRCRRPRGGFNLLLSQKTELAPLCLTETLIREAMVIVSIYKISWRGVNRIGSCAFPQRKKKIISRLSRFWILAGFQQCLSGQTP